METFGYLSVLTSTVLGLAIVRVFSGVGRLVQVRHRVRLYWPHLLWILNLFLFAVLNWWILFRWRTQTEWTFFIFLFLLLSPTIVFLLSALLFPDPFEDGLDMRQHFYANHRWFFSLAALLGPIDAVDTLLKGWDHFAAQGAIYPVTISLVTVLNLVASRTNRQAFHAFFAVFFLIYLLAFIGINLRVLN